jgi:acyl-CoA synthetase (AMP-forming)/AMP-acid ligase II
MNLGLLLEMAADGAPERVALGSRRGGTTYAELLGRADAVAAWLARRGPGDAPERAGLVGLNSPAVPLLLFGCARAGVPFVPLNYRLADPALQALAARTAPSVLVVDDDVVSRIGTPDGVELVERSAFEEAVAVPAIEAPATWTDPEDPAVLLFTSGTTAEPKAAVLRHRHLAAYVVTTVEFMGAGEDEAALVSVPPYHVAGISAVVSSVYAGRRLVQLPAFDPDQWVATVTEEDITHAMVVPTMLGRILDAAERGGRKLPSLRHLAYGGGQMPRAVIERAMTALPHVDFVNAYGLTETSSTIAILGPEDHRQAWIAEDEEVRRRLHSVGRPLPTVEVEIRDELGRPCPPNCAGEIWVRGEQVSGEYLGRQRDGDEGWFATRDGGLLDEAGFLFIEGRLDDVIVRGGENISPGEVEDVLRAHPAVADVAVIGLPDVQWGERVAAVVVLAGGADAGAGELQDWVRSRLRSTKTPELIDIRAELPYNETGKLLRRVLRQELGGEPATS